MALGEFAESHVAGNTNLTINTQANNMAGLEGITVGAFGGGLSAATFGGTATTTVDDTTVTITDGMALGLFGGVWLVL